MTRNAIRSSITHWAIADRATVPARAYSASAAAAPSPQMKPMRGALGHTAIDTQDTDRAQWRGNRQADQQALIRNEMPNCVTPRTAGAGGDTISGFVRARPPGAHIVHRGIQ